MAKNSNSNSSGNGSNERTVALRLFAQRAIVRYHLAQFPRPLAFNRAVGSRL